MYCPRALLYVSLTNKYFCSWKEGRGNRRGKFGSQKVLIRRTGGLLESTRHVTFVLSYLTNCLFKVETSNVIIFTVQQFTSHLGCLFRYRPFGRLKTDLQSKHCQ